MNDTGLLEIHLRFRNRPRLSAREDPQEGLRERLSPEVYEQFGPESDGPDDSLRGLPIRIAGGHNSVRPERRQQDQPNSMFAWRCLWCVYGSNSGGFQLFLASPLVASLAGMNRAQEEDISEIGQVVGRRVVDVSATPTRSIAPARSAP